MKRTYLRNLSLALALLMLTLGIASCDIFPNVETTEPEESTTEPEETTTEPEEEPTVENTPKKYFTLRLDDGVTQDERVIEILKKYGFYGCTFYINTGLLGANWAWVGQQNNRPDVTHKRFTQSQLRSGIYDGFDVQSHSLEHPSLKNCTDDEVTRQYTEDAKRIKALFGYTPVGTAWAGGDTEWNEHSVDVVYATTDIRYGICAKRTTQVGLDTFALPKYFLTWYPTCSFIDRDSAALLEEFIAAEATEDMLMTVWLHSYELDIHNKWEEFELYIKTISEAAAADDSIVILTNTEFYELYKDEIPAWKN